MNARIDDLRSTIIPKSDQLNADQLVSGPMEITVTDVRVGSSDDQPISIHYEGDAGRPYKPCKTMRKVLIFAWGPDGRDWIGRSMTLYHDPQVKWAGAEVGGIRISHLSHIDSDVNVSLAKTKGSKALHTIRRLKVDMGPALDDVLAKIKAAHNKNTMDQAKDLASKLKRPADVATALAAYKARVVELRNAAAPSAPLAKQPQQTLQDFTARIDEASSAETAGLVMDEARDVLNDADMATLQEQYEMAWKA